MSRTSVRIEDVLTALSALTLIAFAGIRSFGRIALTEENYWDFSFILAPVALMVFAAAVQYAFAPRGQSSIRDVSKTTATILRDWSPFLFFLLFYQSFRLGTWLALSPVDRDDLLLRWDRALFGETPSFIMDSWVDARLTSVMTFAYLLHLILPPILALLWYWRDVKMFRQFLLAILLGGLIGVIGYAILPAVGPAAAYPSAYRHSLSSDTFLRITEMVEAARAPRDVFPSLHVGLSSIVLFYCWRYGRTAFFIVLPMVIANWVSTIYLRYHYLIDVFAGWVTAIVAIALAVYLLRLEAAINGRLRQRSLPLTTDDASALS